MKGIAEHLGIDLPDIPVGLVTFLYNSFPNQVSPVAKLLLLIEESKSVTRDNVFDKFGTFSFLGSLVSWNIIRWNMKNDCYSLTKSGHDILKLIKWLAPVYELIDFMNGPDVSDDPNELDLLLTMAGKHHLVEKDVISRVDVIMSYIKDPHYYDHRWVRNSLNVIYHAMSPYQKLLRHFK